MTLNISGQPFNDQCSHQIETSHVICPANQLTGFYVMGTLVVKGLNKLRPLLYKSLFSVVLFCDIVMRNAVIIYNLLYNLLYTLYIIAQYCILYLWTFLFDQWKLQIKEPTDESREIFDIFISHSLTSSKLPII